MRYIVEMASAGVIYIPSFIRIGSGHSDNIKITPWQSESCNVGITDGRDLRITPLRWPQVPW
jgi:hypothetical protein